LCTHISAQFIKYSTTLRDLTHAGCMYRVGIIIGREDEDTATRLNVSGLNERK
jgi:hypothetical protein